MPTNLPNTAASQTSGQQPIPAGGNQPPWRKTAPLLLAALLAALLVAFGLWLAQDKLKPKPPAAPEEKVEVKAPVEFKIYGDVLKVNDKEGTFTIKQKTTNFEFQVKITPSTKFFQQGSGKELQISDLKIGSTVEVASKEVPKPQNMVLPEKINIYPMQPDLKLIPKVSFK